MKTGLSYGSNGYGSNGYDSRIYGRWGLTMDNRYRPRGRGNGYYGFGNESQDGTIELNRGPRSGRFKNQKLFGHSVTIAAKRCFFKDYLQLANGYSGKTMPILCILLRGQIGFNTVVLSSLKSA